MALQVAYFWPREVVKVTRGWGKIIWTNIFNCSASNTHSTRLEHAKKLFIRKFPLKWGIVRFCRSYITRDMGQNVFSSFYEFYFLQNRDLTENEKFTFFTISPELNKLQKSLICQIIRWNLSNLASIYHMALNGPEVGEKRPGSSRKFCLSVSIY